MHTLNLDVTVYSLLRTGGGMNSLIYTLSLRERDIALRADRHDEMFTNAILSQLGRSTDRRTHSRKVLVRQANQQQSLQSTRTSNV